MLVDMYLIKLKKANISGGKRPDIILENGDFIDPQGAFTKMDSLYSTSNDTYNWDVLDVLFALKYGREEYPMENSNIENRIAVENLDNGDKIFYYLTNEGKNLGLYMPKDGCDVVKIEQGKRYHTYDCENLAFQREEIEDISLMPADSGIYTTDKEKIFNNLGYCLSKDFVNQWVDGETAFIAIWDEEENCE